MSYFQLCAVGFWLHMQPLRKHVTCTIKLCTSASADGEHDCSCIPIYSLQPCIVSESNCAQLRCELTASHCVNVAAICAVIRCIHGACMHTLHTAEARQYFAKPIAAMQGVYGSTLSQDFH
jgi:hypothetical protein